MTLYAFTDGASRGNPGHAGIGVLVKDEKGGVLIEEKQYIGKATNNVAEYRALIACLRKLQELHGLAETNENSSLREKFRAVVVHSDSELMVKQVTGVYKIKDKTLNRFAVQVKDLLRSLQTTWTLKHIPREQNRETDRLANQAIDEALL